MKKLIFALLFVYGLLTIGFAGSNLKDLKFDFKGLRDASMIRGFNYTPANAVSPRHHIDAWINYDSATTVFDLDLAKSLNLNQVRIL